jgi:Transposase
MGHRQAPPDQGPHAISCPLGTQTVVAGNSHFVPYDLGQGLPRGRVRRHLGLEKRQLGPIAAIGVDEIQYAKGHKYLTLVYQIEEGCTRLLWIGKERTAQSFEQFFNMIGEPLSEGIQYVCSDMWRPYLKVIKERCSNAINILDRFHIVAKMNDALDDVRAAEARRLAQDGHRPLLKQSRWCILKRKRNLTSSQRFRLRELLHYKPEDRAGLPPQGGLPAALGLQLPDVGSQIPRRLVYPSPCAHALSR